MVELVVADEARVQEIVTAFRDVVWPLPIEDGKRLADGLGWRMERDMSNWAHYFSGMLDAAGGTVDARVSYLDVDVAEVNVRLCNFSKEHARKDMLAVRKQMTACVKSVLGEPSGKQDGNAYWELGNRGRVWVKVLKSTVLLKVLHPRYADIERAEEHFGIPEDRIPGTGSESDYL
ncbi:MULTISPECIES: DUF6301 family protein [unclassified Pseudoclavibacter]|uniref:DUF6301 family protein n=1 Tax=unclassified Pseudoclavibacter TaxID=2615177 RepID=UPI001BADAA1E|nr:DUF6301 family protein [Pseudoclavibacter sp. Marseille-Q4354]MBS3178919.1 hypothetical protein [Pseudoclavibacter sp. Marseille-Q4354]